MARAIALSSIDGIASAAAIKRRIEASRTAAAVAIGHAVTAIPRYRKQAGPALLSAGFRPCFLVAARWAASVIPLQLASLADDVDVPTASAPMVRHVHEMVFGYGVAVTAGFLLTAIPNWTGRMPLQGGPARRSRSVVDDMASGGFVLGEAGRRRVDGSRPCLSHRFSLPWWRENLAGRNWRNLPMLGALLLVLVGTLLVHLDAIGASRSAEFGNRLGVAALLC
jgi:uncharacterized protein involved in response to NO